MLVKVVVQTPVFLKIILRALEELVNLGEELVLSDLIVEAFKDLINWSEVGLNLLLVELLWKVGGNLVASIEDLFIPVLEPDTRHVVLLRILLHGTNIDFILSIQAVHLSEDTGHVADLGLL